ncbi:hypothetical protein DL769_003497 [Monosporascus sp. CRB-8-3]|nr:hypothetical protein DL769_003497 [Monosporascus sp. CRB-8-3]
MKFNSAILALATLVTWANLSGVTCRALGGGNLVTTGSRHGPNTVDARGIGLKPSKGGKSGSDEPDGGNGGPSGGIGGLGSGNGGRGSGRGGSVIGGLGAPGSQSAMTRGDRELDSFGLMREKKDNAESEGAFEGFGDNWNQFRILPKADKVETYGKKAIYEYQTLVLPSAGGAFNTKWVETKDRNLPEGVNRRTLLRNGWTNAGGDPGKLHFLGDSDIINPEVRRSIEDALAQKGRDAGSGPQQVEFKPNEDGWDEINNNPFIGGYNRMLTEDKDAFKDAYIGSIKVIIDEGDNYHLRTRLQRDKRPASESPEESSLSESD